ncbi:hypothetical protein DEA8626_00254 [Defluviimonas aquaemixtae]|uniref:DUF202 domain-containing protein n=1 Tax=Albidovulum aquaemixtae TaxID=1542388 RepID=A0A2R8B2G7_9RHOB|nr:DUF202 domain-containing protein [Defluviimonas aquaemixtae]SPH16743.1 hypothetical protein DEA8626_00254 [Defluviimonas aquaemixtae]
MSKKQTESEYRTDLARDRTLLANERTFASWNGLGLGSVGVAVALKAVFGAFEPTWAAKLVASMFLLAAVLVFWAARHQACKTYARLQEAEAEAQPPSRMTTLAWVLSLSTIATGVVLWSL